MEYSPHFSMDIRIFCGILSIPYNDVMDLNNVMSIMLAKITHENPHRAEFHVPVTVRFLNGWETCDIIQKMGDVTHFMEGYFYVGCRFIGNSYFLTKGVTSLQASSENLGSSLAAAWACLPHCRLVACRQCSVGIKISTWQVPGGGGWYPYPAPGPNK